MIGARQCDALCMPQTKETPTTKLVRQDVSELRKPHEMVVMVPRNARVTLMARKLYNAMMHIAQAKMAAMDAMPAADFVFEAPLPAILRTSGSSVEERTVAKKYIKEMRGLEVDWESTAQGDGLKWMGFSMLAQASIEVRGGENWVAWAYPPAIMSALRDPARWARLDLSIMSKLGTYSAVALYEICARYRDNPSGVTSRKPVTWWANALSNAPAGSEKREWRKFKSERVKPAIEEINRETDLEIEMIEFKEGRSFTDVQFAVRRKRIDHDQCGTYRGPVDASLVLRAESHGIREIKLEELINTYGEDKVRSQLDVLERRGDGQQQGGRFAELRGLLRGEIGPRPLKESKPHRGQNVLDFAVDGAGGVGSPKMVEDKRWLEERIQQLRSEVAALDESARKSLGEQAASILAERGQLNAIVTRRLQQGDILHGLLGATVVQVYGEAAYGQNWNIAPIAA